MTTIIEHEAEQVRQANATERQPVVFIHGLWLLPSSWDRWAAVFEEAGYTTLTPGWPDDPETIGEAKAEPEVFAHKTIGQVADHFEGIIRGLPLPVAEASFKLQQRNTGETEMAQMPGRGHALTFDAAWRQVDTALTFVQRFA